MKINFKSGQTIIEAVVALGLIIVVLTATSVVVTTSVNNSDFIKRQSLASKYANQGMESLRFLRNNPPPAPTPSFDTYAAQTSAYCMCPTTSSNNIILGDNNCNPGNAGSSCTKVDNFSGVLLRREVKFDANASDCSGIVLTPGGTKVTVTVYWSSGKCPAGNAYCHKTQLISCLAKPSSSGSTL